MSGHLAMHGDLALMTLDRQEAMNALSGVMIVRIAAAIDAAAAASPATPLPKRRSFRTPMVSNWEARLFSQVSQTEDAAEAMRDFIEKRKPRFLGR